MWNLFKAELLRFRRWGIAFALLHLLLLAFVARLVDLAQQPLLVYQAWAALHGLVGLLLGLYQMAGYRRPNAWLNLLHRPLPAWRIGAALLAAGATWLFLALLLPGLLVAGAQDLLSARIVDQRHLLLPLAGWLVALCGYAAGAWVMLARRRYGVFALVLLALPAVSAASGPAAIGLQLLVLGAWLALVAIAFRPDLDAAPRRPFAVVLVALAVQAGLYVTLLVSLGLGLQFAWIAIGSHPLNTPTPLAGGAIEASQADGRALMLAGLAGSTAPQAMLWREQVPLSEVDGLAPWNALPPRRHALTQPTPAQFSDRDARVEWTFSHDSMHFHGIGIADGQPAGTLGIDGEGRLGVPPLPVGDGLLAAGNRLLRYDADRRVLRTWLTLPDSELIAASPRPVGQHLAVLGDRALYLFDLRRDDGIAAVDSPLRLPLPDAIGNLGSVELLQLLDGWLVSFTYLRWAHTGDVAPFQQVLHVDDGGAVATVARRELLTDFPDLFRWLGWWLSPAMHEMRRAAEGLLADPSPLQATNPPPVPDDVRIAAAGLLLLSLLAAAWISRGRLRGRTRVVWIAACALVGLPALLSLWLMQPQRESTRPLPAAAQRGAVAGA